MAISVKAVQRTSKARADGTAPVWIRVTANRKSRFLATGIYIEPKYWNPTKQQVRTTHPIAPALNDKLRTLLLEAQQQALDADTAQEVKDSLTVGGGSLTAYFEQFIEGLDAAGRFWDWKKYRVTLGKLQNCFGKQISWQDLDRQGLVRFERRLRDKYGNTPNTVRKELQRVRRVVRQAMKDGVLRPEHDPFLTYDKPKAKQTHRRRLSLEEIAALEAASFPEGSWERKARDAWLFAFYAGGMRFGDVASLKVENLVGARVQYRMLKTGTPVSLPLPSNTRQLLAPYVAGKRPEDFLFPFLKPGEDSNPVRHRRRISSANAMVNRYLKAVAEQAGIAAEGLSMHVARHSFADYARTRSGNLYAISKTLGHASLQITQAYLKSFDLDAVDQLADELWGNHEGV